MLGGIVLCGCLVFLLIIFGIILFVCVLGYCIRRCGCGVIKDSGVIYGVRGFK